MKKTLTMISYSSGSAGGGVLMVEMTGQYEFMLPLLVSCLSAYGIAEAFRAPAIYDALRHRNCPQPDKATT